MKYPISEKKNVSFIFHTKRLILINSFIKYQEPGEDFSFSAGIPLQISSIAKKSIQKPQRAKSKPKDGKHTFLQEKEKVTYNKCHRIQNET